METARRLLLPLALIALATALPASAQSELESARASLHGIDGFVLDVEVEKSGSLDGRPGLAVKALRDTVLHVLGEARLNVLTPPPGTEATPRLLVHVNALDMGRGLVPFSLSLRLQQGVSLVRNPAMSLQAGTWESNLVGLASLDRLLLIREAAADLTHEFIEDYRRVNP